MVDNLRELRRYENMLYVSGFGVLALGAWDVIKVGLFYFIQRDRLIDASQLTAEQQKVTAWMLPLIILIILAVDVLFRLTVGLKARAECRGKKVGKVYIILAVIGAIATVAFVVIDIIDVFSGVGIAQSIASTLVDVTGFVIYCEIVLAAKRVRRFRKNITEVTG